VNTIILCIVVNTVMLAMTKYPNWDPYTQNVFDKINIFFTILFTVELIIRIIAFGIER